MRRWLLVITCFITIPAVSQDHSVAREWNEVLLEAIRNDFARPTVHARNLFHSSAVMYDAWAAYDAVSAPYFLGNQVGDYTFPFNGVAIPTDPFERQAAQEEAMSYAVYRLLKHRFEFSPGAEESLERFDSLMVALGYDIVYANTDYENEGPAALGNYIADNVILYGLGDGSNEETDFSNQYYLPVNEELVMVEPGNPDIEDPNRWQPLNIPEFIDQGGNPFTVTPPFLSPEWGNVVGFALDDSVKTTYERDGDTYHVFHDPGPPPFIDTLGTRENDEAYRWGFSLVSIWQSHHDPADGVLWDVSPASIGNVPSLPTDFADYENFYNLLDGGDNSLGHEINPHTGAPYEPQIVPRADYARILAEFWADGPDSETPPGHWFDILNYVNDHPDLEKRWKGEGPILDDLEWDVKTYFSLGGAMHDAAIAAWSVKGWYDYIRPVSAIRFMADRGQNSDPDLPSFDAGGIPLVEGLVELVEPGDPLAGLGNVNVGKIKLYTWRGPDYIEDPEVDMAGVGWILAENWWPYQRPTFVTPPFAGYVSGHSTYSRAAAEMMTFMTGDAYFPGGMGEFEAPQNEFLVFEEGPSVDVTLQWATYRDASDQCSLSRIWGGIHPPADDIPGRLMGIEIGNNAFIHANEYFDAGLPSLINATPNAQAINLASTGETFTLTLEFDQFMNTEVNPTISFQPSILSDVLGDPSYNWVNENMVEVIWQITNVSVEVFESTIQISGAESAEALPMVEAGLENLFIVDQIVPLAQNVASTALLINDDATGESVQFDLFFSEPMNEENAPVVEFTTSLVADAASISNGQWLNSDQYRLTVEFDDTGIEEEDVLIAISGAEDLANNPSVDVELTTSLSIDTRNPLVDLVLFSENPIVVEASETEGFTVLILFDEQMEETDDLQLILTGSLVNDILTPSGNGEWQNPFNYLQTYDILAEAPAETSVSLTIVDAKDAAGNTMEFTSLEDAFNIVVDVVGVEENEDAVLTLFPNPLSISSQELYLSGNRNYELWNIYSIDGKWISSGSLMGTNVERIPLIDIAAGQYILRLTGKDRDKTIPFFIQAN